MVDSSKKKLFSSKLLAPMAMAMADLPKDIIFNIFSRLPIKPLFTFRSVSKQWRKLIDHPHLSRVHIHQQHPIPFILSPSKHTTALHLVQLHHFDKKGVPTLHAPLMEFDLNPSNLSFGFCNGLLYFTHQNPSSSSFSSVTVSNPLRKECLKLPPIPISNHAAMKTYGLGFDSSINSFKMVCVLWNECTMIQTIGSRTSSWRKMPQLPPCPISGSPVFSRGFLYWKVDPYSHSDHFDYDNTNSLIVSFDVKNEEFSFTPHPELDSSDSSLFQLLDLNGNLAIVDFGKCGGLTVRVMKDYEERNWAVEYNLPILRPENVTSLSKDGDILIESSCGFFIYKPRTDDLKYMHNLNTLQPNPTVYSFTGSLFSLSNVLEES